MGSPPQLCFNYCQVSGNNKIDYGSFTYGSAKKYLPKKLDIILHVIFQSALGSLKSIIAAMYCEVRIQSLHFRRKYLKIYFAKKVRLKIRII